MCSVAKARRAFLNHLHRHLLTEQPIDHLSIAAPIRWRRLPKRYCPLAQLPKLLARRGDQSLHAFRGLRAARSTSASFTFGEPKSARWRLFRRFGVSSLNGGVDRELGASGISRSLRSVWIVTSRSVTSAGIIFDDCQNCPNNSGPDTGLPCGGSATS